MTVFSENIEIKPTSNTDIICPDAISICPANCTCCISIDGDYSCCPVQEGVCCSDHKHCCPKHYKCDHVFSATMLGVQPSLNKS